ncbi:precorrin-3B C(17)-methyltransferase [Lichenicoccus sp.]|uniref:precorrin-3B C(17)-methyltransferase n=1 Tax=Lichenicoccus sp. TaxID=2781899 RepID=UPI003D14F36F
MTGRLVIVGLGPGDPSLRTPQVSAALAAATDLVGYGPYLQRIEGALGAIRHTSDNRQELDRARHALSLAAEGRRVAVVSSGDAGVFAMASAVFEAIEHGDPAWRRLDVAVMPGISAMLAVAARLGAPLGHDFCVLSLSDNLKPWPVVLRRLQAAAAAGLGMALYNPVSAARPWQLGEALDALRALLPGTVPVVFATAISRPEERIVLTDLADASPEQADMRTLVLVGTEATRSIARGEGRTPWLYAPRGAGAA